MNIASNLPLARNAMLPLGSVAVLELTIAEYIRSAVFVEYLLGNVLAPRILIAQSVPSVIHVVLAFVDAVRPLNVMTLPLGQHV